MTLCIALLLSGCATMDPAPQVQERDPAMASLTEGMDRCLAMQEKTLEQLGSQQRQIREQHRQLQALAAEAAEAGAVAGADQDAVGVCSTAATADKLVLGELETVWLHNLQLALPARIDTGAETASLDARNIELFERDGRRWVRFDVPHPQDGEPLTVERKLKRMVTIVQSNTSEAERRPVIILGITIGHIAQTAEFTLSNRSHLDYQVLVGRNILKDVMVVDVSRKHAVPLPQPEEEGSSGPSP